MARNSSILSITVLGNSTSAKRAMNEAANSVKNLQKTIGGATSGIGKMFAGLGVGLSIGAFVKMGQAAAQDAKSMNLMALSIDNATSATREQITASEAYIQSLSNQFGILDDDLRPALTVLTATYGDLDAAQAAMIPTLDLAAYASVDATTAANALAKANKGQYKQLYALIPALRGAADPMAKLQELTKGAATAASNSDPFQKLTVIFDNLQETIGQYLLPYIQAFTDWLNTPQGQEQLRGIADAFGKIAVFVFNIISWLSNNFWLAATIVGLTKFVKIWWAIFKVVTAVKKATKELTVVQAIAAALKTAFSPAGVVAAIGAGALVGAAIIGASSMFGDSVGNAPVIDPFSPTGGALPTVRTPGLPGAGGSSATAKVIKKTNDDVKKGIETLKKSFGQIQALVKSFSDKFRGAVELAFGIIDRASGKMFRADRYVRELKRMVTATADFQKNLATLQAIGGKAATPLINQILGMSPEEGAAIMRGFIQSPEMFSQAIALGNQLGQTGTNVGRAVNQMNGNLTEQQTLAEIKLLRADLAKGKNTYNIKATMTATEILAAIRTWEKTNHKTVLVG